MHTRATHPALLIGLLAAAGCYEMPTELPQLVGPENIVAVGNEANAFGVSVQARDLSFEQTYDLAFESDTTSIGLAVVGYSGGVATLEILDEAGTPIYSRSLAANTAEGSAELCCGHPAQARLRFTGYTGIVALGIGGN